MAGKLVQLDALRGLMALWVFTSHVVFLMGEQHGLFLLPAAGGLAVSVFVTLSGFAIASSLRNARQPCVAHATQGCLADVENASPFRLRADALRRTVLRAAYGRYLARRFVRIYPIYLVALGLGIATSPLYPPLLDSLGWIDPVALARIGQRTAGEAVSFVPHLLAHLSLLHGAVPDTVLYGAGLSFNGPLWSLSLEWQFYLVAPFLVAVVAAARRNTAALAATVLIAAAAGPLLGARFGQVPSFLPLQLGYFLLGIATAVFLPALAQRADAALAAAAVMVAVLALAGRPAITMPVAIWLVVVASCVAREHPVLGLLHRLLSNRFLVQAGERSYGFYVLHMPVLIVWGIWLQQHGFASSKALYGAMLLAALPATLGLAWLSFGLLEQPLNAWAKRRFGGAAAPLPDRVRMGGRVGVS